MGVNKREGRECYQWDGEMWFFMVAEMFLEQKRLGTFQKTKI
jgi:hypothetical protein